MNNNKVKTREVTIGDELRLVALLSHPNFDHRQRSLVMALQRKSDLVLLRDLIVQHRVWPCVYCNIHEHFADDFPEGFIRDLERQYHQAVEQSHQQFRVYGQILHAFGAAGIPVRTLKGVPLARKLYGDFAKRQCRDIDLLIPREYLEQAHHQLMQIGFRAPQYNDLNASQRSRYFDANKDITYVQAQNVCLELHIRLCETRSPLSLQGAQKLFDNAGESQLEEFIYLCWHASHSLFHRLKWAQDIALFIDHYYANESVSRAERLNVGKIIDRAIYYDELRSVVVSWAIAHYLFGAPIPEKIESLYVEDKIAQLLLTLAVAAMHKPAYILSISHKFEVVLCNLLFSKTWHARWQKLQQKIRPNVNVVSKYPLVPESLFFLYYILRPVDLLHRHLSGKS